MARKPTHTVVTMIAADAAGATFGIFRAYVRDPARRWTWNLHHAQPVCQIHVPAGTARESYRAMAEQFATSDYPALGY